MCSDHPRMTTSGFVSNHTYGRGLDIASIDGEIVSPGSALAREVASELSDFPSLDPRRRDRLARSRSAAPATSPTPPTRTTSTSASRPRSAPTGNHPPGSAPTRPPPRPPSHPIARAAVAGAPAGAPAAGIAPRRRGAQRPPRPPTRSAAPGSSTAITRARADAKVAPRAGSDSGLFAALDPKAAQPAQVAATPAPPPDAAAPADAGRAAGRGRRGRRRGRRRLPGRRRDQGAARRLDGQAGREARPPAATAGHGLARRVRAEEPQLRRRRQRRLLPDARQHLEPGRLRRLPRRPQETGRLVPRHRRAGQEAAARRAANPSPTPSSSANGSPTSNAPPPNTATATNSNSIKPTPSSKPRPPRRPRLCHRRPRRLRRRCGPWSR